MKSNMEKIYNFVSIIDQTINSTDDKSNLNSENGIITINMQLNNIKSEINSILTQNESLL